MIKRANRFGIVFDWRITFGEMLTLGILLTVLVSGFFILRSDIAQLHTELSATLNAGSVELDARLVN